MYMTGRAMLQVSDLKGVANMTDMTNRIGVLFRPCSLLLAKNPPSLVSHVSQLKAND
jgi:hypothetical protein